jgi:CRP-like cAMP-binding protein
MSSESQRTCQNRLLRALPPVSFGRLEPYFEKVDLFLKMTLVEPHKVTPHVFFIENGLASVVASAGGGENHHIEVGHIGWDGMSASHVALNVSSTPNHTFMQGAGSALRIPTSVFRKALETDADLRNVILRYVHTYKIQLAQSALANGRYKMHERLARWLLMCHDRMEGNDLAITHEFLATMLGVRRSGVTEHIHVLEGMGIIRNIRGRVRVKDRAGLEEVAGGSYGVPEEEFERLIGKSFSAVKEAEAAAEGLDTLVH